MANPLRLDLPARRRSAVPLASSAVVGAVSVLALIGWSAGIPAAFARDGAAAMPPDTAAGLLAGALGLACVHRERRRPALGFASLLVMLGGVTLLASWLGIDARAARMEPNTALAFLLFGAAIVVAEGRRDRIHNVGVGVLAGGVEVLGVFALLGQAFGLDSASGWGHLVYIAPATAVAISVLGLGPTAIAWRGAAEDRARYGPGLAITALAGMLGSILLAVMLLGEDVRFHRALLRSELARFEHAAQRLVAQRVTELERMARRWDAHPASASGTWLADAQSYLADADVYEAIVWRNPDGSVREVAQTDDPRAVAPAVAADLESAIRGGATQVDHVSAGDEQLVRIVVPLARDGAIVATLSAPRLLELALRESDIGAHVRVAGENASKAIYSGPGESRPGTADTRVLAVGNLLWTIRGWPSDVPLVRTLSPVLALVGGILLTLVATWALSHRRTALERAAAIERVSEQLARSNEELGRFAYVASHDLQEPLRIVTSFCKRLAERYNHALDDTGRTYVGFIVDAAERMGDLIEGLLRYSRIEGQNQELVAVDCNTALADALGALREIVSETAAEITSDRLPTIEGNPLLLAQLFQNLIGNALKYRSEERPRVHVGATEYDDFWELSVADNGIGIDPKYQSKIFEMFERLPSKDGAAGAGIGLALCRKVVERLDGRIWVESTPGQGSTFSFALPKRHSAAVADLDR